MNNTKSKFRNTLKQVNVFKTKEMKEIQLGGLTIFSNPYADKLIISTVSPEGVKVSLEDLKTILNTL